MPGSTTGWVASGFFDGGTGLEGGRLWGAGRGGRGFFNGRAGGLGGLFVDRGQGIGRGQHCGLSGPKQQCGTPPAPISTRKIAKPIHNPSRERCCGWGGTDIAPAAAGVMRRVASAAVAAGCGSRGLELLALGLEDTSPPKARRKPSALG